MTPWDAVPWCFFVFVSSSSLAGGSPVQVAARCSPVSQNEHGSDAQDEHAETGISGVRSAAGVHGGGVLLTVSRARGANGAIVVMVSVAAGARACRCPGLAGNDQLPGGGAT